MNAMLSAIQILADNLLEGLWGIGFFLVLIVVSVLTQAIKKMKEDKERQEQMRRGGNLRHDQQAQQPPRPKLRQDPRLAEQIRRTMGLPAEPPVRPNPAEPASTGQRPTPPPTRAPQQARRRKPPAQLKIKPRSASAKAKPVPGDEGVLPDTPLHHGRSGRKNAVNLGLDDPATLRRALIYHEVFSKPVGLRNPGQHPQ